MRLGRPDLCQQEHQEPEIDNGEGDEKSLNLHSNLIRCKPPGLGVCFGGEGRDQVMSFSKAASVIGEACSDAKNTTKFATSAGLMKRLISDGNYGLSDNFFSISRNVFPEVVK